MKISRRLDLVLPFVADRLADDVRDAAQIVSAPASDLLRLAARVSERAEGLAQKIENEDPKAMREGAALGIAYAAIMARLAKTNAEKTALEEDAIDRWDGVRASIGEAHRARLRGARVVVRGTRHGLPHPNRFEGQKGTVDPDEEIGTEAHVCLDDGGLWIKIEPSQLEIIK